MRLVAATAPLLALLAMAAMGASSDKGTPPHSFMKVYRVLQHPRCMNCHPSGDSPLHGDDSHAHSFGVKRGEDGFGEVGARCSKCHQSANQPGEHRPPGAAHTVGAKQLQAAAAQMWHLPAPKMKLVFQGRTPSQLCQQLLDQNTNGGLTVARLREHVEEHPLVKWGWRPGDGRTKPPGTHATFVEAVRDWIQEGPNCPAE